MHLKPLRMFVALTMFLIQSCAEPSSKIVPVNENTASYRSATPEYKTTPNYRPRTPENNNTATYRSTKGLKKLNTFVSTFSEISKRKNSLSDGEKLTEDGAKELLMETISLVNLVGTIKDSEIQSSTLKKIQSNFNRIYQELAESQAALFVAMTWKLDSLDALSDQTKICNSEPSYICVFQEAINTVREIKGDNILDLVWDRQFALENISEKMARAGRLDLALKIVDLLGPHMSPSTRVSIIEARASAGDIVTALKSANNLKYAQYKSKALLAVAKAQIKADDFEAALNLLNEFRVPSIRDQIIIAVVRRHAGQGRWNKALEIASGISNHPQRLAALTAMAEIAFQSGNRDRANTLEFAARQIAISLKYRGVPVSVLRDLAVLQVKLGDVAGANRIARWMDREFNTSVLGDSKQIKIKKPGNSPDGLGAGINRVLSYSEKEKIEQAIQDIIMMIARSSDVDGALAIIRKTDYWLIPNKIQAGVIKTLTDAGRYKHAMEKAAGFKGTQISAYFQIAKRAAIDRNKYFLHEALKQADFIRKMMEDDDARLYYLREINVIRMKFDEKFNFKKFVESVFAHSKVIEKVAPRAHYVLRMADLFAENDHKSIANRLFSRSIEIARTIKSDKERDEILAILIHSLLEEDNPSAALSAYKLLKPTKYEAYELGLISRGYLKIGSAKDAMDILKLIKNAKDRARELAELALFMVHKRHDNQRASWYSMSSLN